MGYGDGSELEKFEIAMQAAGLAWWWIELPSGVMFFSPNKVRMLGRKPDNFFHYKDFTSLIHPEDLDRIVQDMRDHMEGKKEVYETTYRIKHIDGHYVRFYDRGKIVGQNDKETLIAGFALDQEQFGNLTNAK